MINDFIIMLMTGFSGYLGGNVFLITGMALFFMFGLIYALGLPRFLTIPMAVIAVFIVMGFNTWFAILGGFGIGIGIAFLLYAIFR